MPLTESPWPSNREPSARKSAAGVVNDPVILSFVEGRGLGEGDQRTWNGTRCLDMDWHFAATAFATALTIVDPIGMIPVTVTSTAHCDPARRGRIVDLAILVGSGVMLAMGLVGPFVLDYLGITLPAFGIAGGLLLFLIAIDMLFARPSGTRATSDEQHEAAAAENPAVFPLAIPMIAGPGTLATVMLLVNQSRGDISRYATVAIAYAAVLLITWLCMRGAASFAHHLSTTAVHVVTRLLGIILAALAVQFVINGLLQTPLLHR